MTSLFGELDIVRVSVTDCVSSSLGVLIGGEAGDGWQTRNLGDVSVHLIVVCCHTQTRDMTEGKRHSFYDLLNWTLASPALCPTLWYQWCSISPPGTSRSSRLVSSDTQTITKYKLSPCKQLYLPDSVSSTSWVGSVGDVLRRRRQSPALRGFTISING